MTTHKASYIYNQQQELYSEYHELTITWQNYSWRITIMHHSWRGTSVDYFLKDRKDFVIGFDEVWSDLECI